MSVLNITYKPVFLRQYKKLPKSLQEEVKEKLALFHTDYAHPSLHTHKLRGALKGSYSFSVNYSYRIIFEFESKHTVVLLAIGDHDIYT